MKYVVGLLFCSVLNLSSATAAVTDEQRKDFLNEYNVRLQSLESKIDHLEKAPLRVPTQKKEEAIEALTEAREGLIDVRMELRQLRFTPLKDWQDEKEDFISTFNDLEDSLNQARQYYY